MYLIAAFAVGSIAGATHGYKRSHGKIVPTCQDALIGGVLYPIMLPFLPIVAFKSDLIKPKKCEGGGELHA